jgi:hypothetical protein
MSGHTAQRTLVKSPPELWAEVSDAAALAKHLGEFGEIRITRLEPETVVAWEGDHANGTVSLAPAGWGTRVTLTASAVPELEIEPEIAGAPVEALAEPAADAPDGSESAGAGAEATSQSAAEQSQAATPEPKRGFFARLRRWLSPATAATRWQLSDGLPPQPPEAAEPSDVNEPELADPIPLQPREPEPEPEPEPSPAAESTRLGEVEIVGILTDVLDTLGAAHHRPFSRG